jgi:hypothetical protein
VGECRMWGKTWFNTQKSGMGVGFLHISAP